MGCVLVGVVASFLLWVWGMALLAVLDADAAGVDVSVSPFSLTAVFWSPGGSFSAFTSGLVIRDSFFLSSEACVGRRRGDLNGLESTDDAFSTRRRFPGWLTDAMLGTYGLSGKQSHSLVPWDV